MRSGGSGIAAWVDGEAGGRDEEVGHGEVGPAGRQCRLSKGVEWRATLPPPVHLQPMHGHPGPQLQHGLHQVPPPQRERGGQDGDGLEGCEDGDGEPAADWVARGERGVGVCEWREPDGGSGKSKSQERISIANII